jgi:hypothetical protein
VGAEETGLASEESVDAHEAELLKPH